MGVVHAKGLNYKTLQICDVIIPLQASVFFQASALVQPRESSWPLKDTSLLQNIFIFRKLQIYNILL